VEYACQDADLTGQLALVLGEVRRELVGTGGEWDVDSEDWDH
jgi:hypothetical protein